MSYHIEYIPQTHDRSKHSKGNGSKKGRIEGHNCYPWNLFGKGSRAVYIPFNIGCEHWHNCFTCPFPDCKSYTNRYSVNNDRSVLPY